MREKRGLRERSQKYISKTDKYGIEIIFPL